MTSLRGNHDCSTIEAIDAASHCNECIYSCSRCALTTLMGSFTYLFDINKYKNYSLYDTITMINYLFQIRQEKPYYQGNPELDSLVSIQSLYFYNTWNVLYCSNHLFAIL